MRARIRLLTSDTAPFFRLRGSFIMCRWSLANGTWPSASPHWMSYTGTSTATRCTRFFSATSMRCTRFGGPSETRMTPGNPTTRKTRSWSRLTATGFSSTYQVPRRLCRIAYVAPGWPWSIEYCAFCANRLKMTIPTSTAAKTPNTIHVQLKITPMTTNTTSVPRADA